MTPDNRIDAATLVRSPRTAVATALALAALWSGSASAVARALQPQVGETATAVDDALLAELAARCGSRVDWAPDWRQAALRARRDGRRILLVAYLYGNLQLGVDLTRVPMFTTFEDDEVVALVNERFVPLWYRSGDAVPFVGAYGVGPLAFGRGIFVVEPDGQVVAELERVDTPTMVDAFLREQLAPATPPGPEAVERADPPERYARAVELERGGDLDAALAWLAGVDSFDALTLSGDIHARRFEAEPALTAWRAARPLDPSRLAQLQVREAAVRIGLGELDEAATLLAACLASDDGEVLANALTLRATLDLAAGEPAEADAALRRLVSELPDQPRARAAAGVIVSGLLELVEQSDPRWPSPTRFDAAVRPSAPATLPVRQTSEAMRAAVEWLIRAQRADGSWAAGHELRDEPASVAHAFTESATAVAARALLRAPGDRARAAATRAVAYVVGRARSRATARPQPAGMDYTPWADAMLLDALSAARAAELLDPETFAEAVDAVVGDLASRVQRDGGWGYYAPATDDPAGSPSISMSFTTAAVLQGLARAREQGAAVDAAVIEGAIGALEGMRSADDWYGYLAVEGVRQPGDAEQRGATGRGPVCAMALWRVGEVRGPDLALALERFFDGLPLLARERGKVLMHCGPGGLGCHYLSFDYLSAAEAMACGDVSPRDALVLMERVLELRRADGSFSSTPILGASYATAAALITLDELRPRSAR
ncbi:hypothetical protein [Engelhardtia mirabilis]|uniref:Prenyltransferase and squalene oxidase repeat protein n=1 Tax=Engelhardtia mirabilis TaxID=2528011 RepID=A0A518BIR9_9BACT|nr:hypothetical protein Pla133_19460 [Planctomycetes bacterium Pla133]QDV01196.1 hypothetical protein Pla86_19450 [Planctomycetes bacterium Pla86]